MFGLYIGDTNIFTATARRRPGGLDIANAKITALPEGLIINGYIQDESRCRELLSGILAGYSGAERGDFRLQVDSTTVIYRDIDVPAMNAKALDKYVYNTMQVQIANADEYYIDYAVTPSGDAKTSHVFVAALPRRLVSSYRKLIGALGIKKFSFAITTVSLMQWMVGHTSDKENRCQIIAAQYGGLSKTVLFDGARYVIANNVRLSGTTHLQAINQRISELIQFQKVKDPDSGVSRVFVTSDDPDVNSAIPDMAASYGVSIVPADATEHVRYDGQVPAMALAGLIGMFMPFRKTIDFVAASRFDQMSDTAVKQHRQGRIRAILIINLAVVLAAAGLFWGMGYLKSRQAAAVQAKLDDPTFQSDYQQAVTYSTQAAAIQAKIDDLATVAKLLSTQKYIDASYIAGLKQTAGPITFTDISVANYVVVTVSCTSENRAAAYDFVAAMQAATDRFADVTYTGFAYDGGTYSFAVTFTVLKGGE